MTRRLAYLVMIVLVIFVLSMILMNPRPVQGFHCTSDYINISSIHCK